MSTNKRLYVSGVGGLCGSTLAEAALAKGYAVVGTDSDQRGRWFGHEGSVEWRMRELRKAGVRVVAEDFRERLDLVAGADVVVHCASQPSHDFSRTHVLQDSAVNYMGTVELLEQTRTTAPEAVFVFLSTNKVYGDRVNSGEYGIRGDRYVPDRTLLYADGVDERLSIDQSLHTPFGVSKTAADLMVQEYRRTFGMNTVSFRCGCLTGKSGSAVELQGFLGYLVKCAVDGRPYTIYGHGGYQVRDNLDADDLARAILLYAEDPKGAVYNMGGGPENSVSVREVCAYLREKHGCRFETRDGPERLGDHKFWATDLRRFKADYPEWFPLKSVWQTIDEIVDAAKRERAA